VDSSLFAPTVPVIIQGITGRAGRTHAQLMQAYGTRVVGGVATSAVAEPVAGVPVFASCRDAVARTGARASLIMVPPLGVLAAVEDALHGGIEMVVCITEGVPVHDALKIVRLARAPGLGQQLGDRKFIGFRQVWLQCRKLLLISFNTGLDKRSTHPHWHKWLLISYRFQLWLPNVNVSSLARKFSF
jgi:hypothetical protein